MPRSKAGIAVSRLWPSHQCGLMTYTSVLLGSMNATPIRLIDLFRYYQKLGHQTAAINELEAAIHAAAPGLLARDQDWYSTWSAAVEAPAPQWPLTKAELGQIMLCKPESLPDDLMDDLARCCEVFKIDTRTELAHFLGQCGHESGGLRYPVEIHSGSNYEGRQDLGNAHPGDGVKFAGTGWLQCTGRYNHQRFSDYLSSIGKPDPKVMQLGKAYTSETYPWTISGFWWHDNKMKSLIDEGASIDQVGAKVNGRMPPNGAQDRRDYTTRALKVLNGEAGERILDVPYEYQLDNLSGTGYRECFSSSCAMIAKYHGQVDSDDEYNIIRARFGDTTDAQAQVKALRSLGFDARFRTDCSAATLEAEIDAGRPVAVGWLHHGPSTAPRGGGHWTCVIGYAEDTIIHNDPNGEADMINGGYIGNSASLGAHVEYSRKNWLRRWEVDGPSTGWAILVKPEF